MTILSFLGIACFFSALIGVPPSPPAPPPEPPKFKMERYADILNATPNIEKKLDEK